MIVLDQADKSLVKIPSCDILTMAIRQESLATVHGCNPSL
jgi:hypothetical protein